LSFNGYDGNRIVHVPGRCQDAMKLLNGQNLPALEALGLFVLQLCRRDSVVDHTAVNMGTPYTLSMALFETI